MSLQSEFDFDGCDGGQGSSCDPCRDNWDSTSSPQVKLDYLKQALKQRIEQLQAQEGITKELEDELRKTKNDLTSLKEKYESSDCLNNEIKPEVNLQKLRAALISTSDKLERTLAKISGEDMCGLTVDKNFIEKELQIVKNVKEDLCGMMKGAMQSRIQFSEKSTTHSDSLEKAKMEINCLRRTIVELKGGKGQCDKIHVQDLDYFRSRAVTGVAALEEMKDEIDKIQCIFKKYYSKIPNECEKCQIEECEDKIEKLHNELEDVTDFMSSYIERINRAERKNGNCDLEELKCKLKEKDAEIDKLKCQLNDKDTTMEEICRLKEEQEKLKDEICQREESAEKLKNVIREIEKEIDLKKAQIHDHDKEINDREEDISKLRDGIKDFRERLKNMQIDIAENLKTREVMRVSSSSSTLSNLSLELQELWDILDKSKQAIPCAIEKSKENEQMKDQLKCMEKYVSNKDETLRLMQSNLKMRESQIEELNCKILSAEKKIAKLTQDLEDKCRLISTLQEKARENQKCELKIKDDHIEGLQFEMVDLDMKLKKANKELAEKNQNIECLQDELLIMQSKNFALSQEVEMMEPRIGAMQKNCDLYEKMVKHLQQQIESRECQIESLITTVNTLEDELRDSLIKYQEREEEDSKNIHRLHETVEKLNDQLYCLHQDYGIKLADKEQQLIKERDLACEQQHDCELKKIEMSHLICQLKSEVKILRRQLRDNSSEQELKSKLADIERRIQQDACKQKKYEEKLYEIQISLEETLLEHDIEKKKLMEKLCNEQNENLKRKECMKRYVEEIQCLKCEILDLKEELDAKCMEFLSVESKGCGELSKTNELIKTLKTERCEYKNMCGNLKMDLEKRREAERISEDKIAELKEELRCKTQELNQLTCNYKCVTTKLQQTFKKLKCAEENLNKKKCGGRDEVDEDKDCFEALLDDKNAECSKYMAQIQALQTKFDKLQAENCMGQANKEREIQQLKCDIKRVEKELQIVEENYRRVKEDYCRTQDELIRSAEREACVQKEFTEKERELSNDLKEALAEKNELLISMDSLQKKLEAVCLDVGCKEQTNKRLTEELERLQEQLEGKHFSDTKNHAEKIISDLKGEVRRLKCELESVRNELTCSYENLKISEKKKANFEKLYNESHFENAKLLEEREMLQDNVCELKTQNMMLKEKLCAVSKDSRKSMADSQEKKKYCAKIKELMSQIKTLETRVIPELEQELITKDQCIEVIKMELRDANLCNQRMRNEAVRVMQTTKKYLTAQKCANDVMKSRMDSCSERKYAFGSETRELDNQLKEVTRMNEYLLCELQNSRRDDYDLEPRSFSPQPWGYSHVERDTSPEYFAESGFQSMQPSPTNLAYDIKEFTQELRKASNHYNSLKRYACTESESA